MLKQKGFTLIELMLVVAIIGIIAGIAYPSYRNYVMRTGRSDGQAWLMQIMQAQERYYSQNQTYTDNLGTGGLAYRNAAGTAIAANGAVISENARYSINAAACTGTTIDKCVILTATRQGPQASDSCGNLTLDSRGNKGAATANCW